MGRDERDVYNDKINIDKKLWKEILADDKITDQKTWDILEFYLNSKDFTERAGIVAKKLKYNHCSAVNGIVSAFGLRIINAYPKINAPKYKDGKYACFHVIFLGEKKKDGFYWTLRPELIQALKEISGK